MSRGTLAVIGCWIAAIALFCFIGFMQHVDQDSVEQLQAQIGASK